MGLLTCPDCLEEGKKRILGSVDELGMLFIKRFGVSGGTTIIQSASFMVICTCGFGTMVMNHSNGHVVSYKNGVNHESSN